MPDIEEEYKLTSQYENDASPTPTWKWISSVGIRRSTSEDWFHHSINIGAHPRKEGQLHLSKASPEDCGERPPEEEAVQQG